MGVLVAKFGGSILSDPEGFGDAADYVESLLDGAGRVFVAVSAPSGISDRLIENDHGSIRNTYVNRLSLAEERTDKWMEELDKCSNRDEYLSKGESHSGRILKEILEGRGHDVRFMDGFEAGIVAREGGGVHLENSVKSLRKGEYREINIVGGYVGHLDGKYKILGRNTTDLTGAVVACAFDADEYHLIKDVDGVYRVHPYEKKAEKLSYEELWKMSYRGAEVTHPEAVGVCKEGSITMKIRGLESKGTVISDESGTTSERPIAGIIEHGFEAITVEDPIMVWREKYLSEVVEQIDECIFDISTDPAEITITLDANKDKTLELAGKIEDAINERFGSQPDVKRDRFGYVGVVGEGLRDRPGALREITQAIEEEGVSISLVVGSNERISSPNISFYMDPDKTGEVKEALYRNFMV